MSIVKVEVSNDELRTVRDAMRELNRMVDSLERSESTKFVLTKQNQMRARRRPSRPRPAMKCGRPCRRAVATRNANTAIFSCEPADPP